MISPLIERVIRRCIRPFRVRQGGSGLAYWESRALEFGRRSVLNLGHGEDQYEPVSCEQKREILPHLTRVLRGDERLVLDLGCGPGRFTRDLAALVHGCAIGMDIVRAYLELAPKDESVEYRLMREGEIGLPDDHVDVVWVCLVLGGIREPILSRTTAEIQRVLRRGGLLFLVENTTPGNGSHHWAFRSVAKYQKLFPSISLSHLHDYFDFGERISIMAARKS